MRLVIGLTGGLGTGKSSALAAFGRLGAGAISLDDVSRRLSRKGGPLYLRIARAFGKRYLGPSGEIDRGALGRAVFSRPALRRRLERAAHPAILKEMRGLLSRARRPVTVVDAPLLFEAGIEKEFDATVMVSAPRREALRRLRRRGDLSRAQALARMRAQFPLARKERLADIQIDNRGSLRDLQRKIGEYYRAFELIASSGRRLLRR